MALAYHMRRDLVGRRRWLTESEYDEGLAIATACPGPMAYQLAVYCGYIRFGLTGALGVALAFALSPFVLVTLSAWLYIRFSASWQLRALFYGISPVIVALILKASWELTGKTLKRNAWSWLIAIAIAALTLIFRRELALGFFISGFLGIFVFRKGVPGNSEPGAKLKSAPAIFGISIASITANQTISLFVFFFKTGLLVFGSGLVIVPFLKAYVVDQYHWLSDRQFLDSVAIGMITPGPVVITATFVGYVLQGFKGALAATAGIFAPPVLFTVVATPLLRRYRSNASLQGFIRGITSAVVGALVGTTILVAQSAIGDALTSLIALLSAVIVIWLKKIPEPLIVLFGAFIGLIFYQWMQPSWLVK